MMFHPCLKNGTNVRPIQGGSTSLLVATSASASGCDTNTYCTGYRVLPTASPYKTRAVTSTCTGSAPVLTSRARVQVSTSVAYGEHSVTGWGPNSYAELGLEGYWENAGWYCKKVS